ncbi:hypothetical protein OH77DRAFT_1424080 [Trametes cingulata]|nr:hypothetical protein OH77DRAFT_1424080 [Trametes cingulata]
MQFSASFVALVKCLFAVAAATTVAAVPASGNSGESLASTFVVSQAEMAHWLATTDAVLTFVGEAPNPLAAQQTTVTYCSFRSGNVCGGECTVYRGGATCLDAPATECLSATADVSFCDRAGCSDLCNQLDSCATRLNDGFCFTPGTESIAVPP